MQTLSTSRRIRQRADFERAFTANRVSNKWFVVYFSKNKEVCSRLGLVVGKRAMAKAVSRNFVKRLIREVFRCKFSPDLPIDIVVRVKRSISVADSVEGSQSLTKLLLSVQT